MTELREATYFVLAALLDGPLHGYAVARAAETLSEGRVRLGAGTLYGALGRLADEGLVALERDEVVAGRRRRYYALTDQGRRALGAEAERLRARAALVQDRLGTTPRPAGATG